MHSTNFLFVILASCINWPLIAGLAALALAALACNLCLLCHLFKYVQIEETSRPSLLFSPRCCSCARRRRAYKQGVSQDLLSGVSTPKTKPVNSIQHEDLDGSDNHLAQLNLTKSKATCFEEVHAMRFSLTADSPKQPRVIMVSPYPHRGASLIAAEEWNSGNQSPDYRHHSPMIHSKSLRSEAADRSNVHVTKVPHARPKVEPDQSSPSVTKTRNIAHVRVRPYDSASVECIHSSTPTDAFHSQTTPAEHHQKSKTNASDSSTGNVTIGYVPRPNP